MITPAQVVEMKVSHHAKSLKARLDDPNIKNGDQDEAIDMRNYIMFSITQQNANRPGPLANLTLEDLGKSEQLESGRVIHMANHKTVKTYGGKYITNLGLYYNLYLILIIFVLQVHFSKSAWRYVRGFRTCLETKTNKNGFVFIGKFGRAMTSSSVHLCLKSFAKKTSPV